MRCHLVWIIAFVALMGCDDDDGKQNPSGETANCYDGACVTVELPFAGSPDAPTVVDVALECQNGLIVALATVTDTGGDADLLGVPQSILIYRDIECTDLFIELHDDLAGSGLEESFGTAVDAATDPELYAQICACDSWPVAVDLEDKDANSTEGRVVARVIR